MWKQDRHMKASAVPLSPESGKSERLGRPVNLEQPDCDLSKAPKLESV